MPVQRRSLLTLPLLLAPVPSLALRGPLIVGRYDAERMKSIKGLTFPRVHLYDQAGALVGRDAWPGELEGLKQNAGRAFCCVSDKPAPPGSLGPPPDCKVVVYGEDVREHFVGLRDKAGRSIEYASLPAHRHLVVEYYADWCAPCIPARRALEAFLQTPASAAYVALAVDFSALRTTK